MNLAPRHLSLLFDGPMPVNQLAARREAAPTTVSLMVSGLNRQGVVDRTPDPTDRRRTTVPITRDPDTRAAVEGWLANGADARQKPSNPPPRNNVRCSSGL